MSRTRRVAVVGGGIAGLAAARDLHEGGAEVTVFEPGTCGGKLRTEELAGHPIDLGADAFLTRVPDAVALCRELRMDADLVAPAAGRAALWWRNGLVTLPPGLVLGVPSRLGGVARSGILSPTGLARAALDRVLPATPLAEDVSVRELVAARFGAEVADRLVDPLVGGIHAGRTSELSAAATTPQLLAAARRRRSLAEALRSGTPSSTTPSSATPGAAPPGSAAPGPAEPPGPVFLTPRGGLGELVDRLVRDLATRGVTVVHQPVREVRAATPGASDPSTADHRAQGCGPGASGAGGAIRLDGAPEPFDGAVLAVPAAVAAGILGPAAPIGLAGISAATVTLAVLAYQARELAPPPGLSGFLVPRVAGRLMTACSFASSKWPHWAEPATTLLRVSAGRDGDDRQDQLDDEELVAALVGELREALGTAARPVESRVVRWPGAFPQYRVGHLKLVARIEADLHRQLPTVVLAGASYRGSGIPACIRSGRQAAAAVLAATAPA